MSWICPKCETENPDRLNVCEVCDLPRESSPLDKRKERMKEKYSDAVYKSFIRYHYDLLDTADKGDVKAQYQVAEWFCFRGKKTSTDEYSKIAVHWYSKAAIGGLVDAQFKLASCYENGVGVVKTKEEAIVWYDRAASKGWISAREKYIKLKYNSVVYDSVIRYRPSLLYNADKGDTDAQYQLGEWFNDHHGNSSYRTEAIDWYRKAAKGYNKKAQLKLAESYLYGKLTKKDVKEALRWYRLAGNYISALDLYNIGVAYDVGNGIKMDKVKAVEYYRKAADKGNKMAQYNLGVCYENGTGVDKDIDVAKYWYEKAAAQGHERAQQCVSRINEELNEKKKKEIIILSIINIVIGSFFGIIGYYGIQEGLPKWGVNLPYIWPNTYPTNLIICLIVGNIVASIMNKDL